MHYEGLQRIHRASALAVFPVPAFLGGRPDYRLRRRAVGDGPCIDVSVREIPSQSKGFTKFDNYFLDTVMPKVGGVEWKVICAILRRTVGYQKEWARITVAEFLAMTGHERQAVVEALKDCLTMTAIMRRTEQRGRQRSFQFQAVARGNLKSVPKRERGRRRQSDLPFDVVELTEFENQTPTSANRAVEMAEENSTEFENQTASRGLKIKLRSGVTEFENQTPKLACPNDRSKESVLSSGSSDLERKVYAVEKADRETDKTGSVILLCRFCREVHADPLRSPAVTLYRQTFPNLTPNEGFRHDIWVTVEDLLLWSEILNGWWYLNAQGKRVDKNPLAVKAMLQAYELEMRRRKERGRRA